MGADYYPCRVHGCVRIYVPAVMTVSDASPLCRVPGPQVKDGESMRHLWADAENHTDFLDFSPVFTHDKDRGWAHVREERS